MAATMFPHKLMPILIPIGGRGLNRLFNLFPGFKPSAFEYQRAEQLSTMAQSGSDTRISRLKDNFQRGCASENSKTSVV